MKTEEAVRQKHAQMQRGRVFLAETVYSLNRNIPFPNAASKTLKDSHA